ncbi:O-antigen ligase family protein [Rheinheimera sediminis]|uniref:O-antigen ligase family protein n=1 Tax=Rheinheimera sp. YQF-1 TaxID=2499626 RepID=UPI000FD9D1E2|nr:O-antigen ligase family protein [Rheinheimera sp. YQF-1]RVT46866.1 O-antigen ligase family protein [Rheinheimera sp. YQF-1]
MNTPHLLNQIVRLLCCLTLCWSPIPLASNRPWAWAILELLVLAIFCLHLIAVYFGRSPWFVGRWQQYSLLPFVAVMALLSAQLWSPVDWLSTVDPNQTQILLIKTLCYGLFAWLITSYFRTDDQLKLLCYAIIASGVFQATYGAILNLQGAETSPLFGVPEGNRARGSFVYQNHFANYLAMTLAVGIGLLMAQLSSHAMQWNWRNFSRTLVSSLLSSKIILRLALIIMVIGLILSRSRMGNAAFFTALLAIALYAIWFYKNRPALLKALVISIFVFDMVAIGSIFGIEKLQQRYQETSFASEARDEVVRDGMPIIYDAPWFGHGGGSFYTVFPAYQPGHYHGFYDHAHNEYLQFAIEFGVPVTLGLGIWLLWALWLNLQTMRLKENKISRGIAFGCAIAIVHMLIHNLVDFNLQAPANAVLFITLLCLSCIVYTRKDIKLQASRVV